MRSCNWTCILALGAAVILGACATEPAHVIPATPAERLAGIRPVTQAMLQEPAAGDWMQLGRSYDGQNFSTLTTINRTNVKKLAPAWRAPLAPQPSNGAWTRGWLHTAQGCGTWTCAWAPRTCRVWS